MQAVNFHQLHVFMAQNAQAMAFADERQLNAALREGERAFELPNSLFRQNYRVTKEMFEIILDIIGPHLREGTRKDSVSRKMKLLIALRFFAQGSYQLSVANDKNMAIGRSTVSKILTEVIHIMNQHLCPELIKFPTSDEELDSIAHRIEQHERMPGVVGYIDGTLVEICSQAIPIVIEHQYVSRKQRHSLNVQIIADDTYKIRGVSAQHRGRSHDAAVWAVSAARNFISQKFLGHNWWLLGDSGYGLEPWLLPPYTPPRTPNQELFNVHHKSMRSLVEKVIGVLKGRWRCLKNERSLHYAPAKCAKIINCCAALHNLCIDEDFDDYMDYDTDDDDHNGSDDDGGNQNIFLVPLADDDLRAEGEANRQHCIQHLLMYQH